jgi:hypothetical protein
MGAFRQGDGCGASSDREAHPPERPLGIMYVGQLPRNHGDVSTRNVHRGWSCHRRTGRAVSIAGRWDRESRRDVESDMTNDGDGLEERLRFIEELVDEQATVAGDVLAIDEHTWAIHGSIAMDGDVIMAEFTASRMRWRRSRSCAATADWAVRPRLEPTRESLVRQTAVSLRALGGGTLRSGSGRPRRRPAAHLPVSPRRTAVAGRIRSTAGCAAPSRRRRGERRG